SVLNTHTDIVSEIDTPKWADLVLFRFFRSQGSVGELVLRDLHGRIRELKAGKGICMTAGAFTDEARRFAEGRPMDLYDKNRLTRILNSID
ncbi:restriction endonuclease, partial [Treponema pallidum]